MWDMNDSQQLKRGQVAPFNPDPRWPAGYFQVLEELRVEERRHPFYAHWVRQFFKRQQKSQQRRQSVRKNGMHEVELPSALARKYPKASKTFAFFPSLDW